MRSEVCHRGFWHPLCSGRRLRICLGSSRSGSGRGHTSARHSRQPTLPLTLTPQRVGSSDCGPGSAACNDRRAVRLKEQSGAARAAASRVLDPNPGSPGRNVRPSTSASALLARGVLAWGQGSQQWGPPPQGWGGAGCGEQVESSLEVPGHAPGGTPTVTGTGKGCVRLTVKHRCPQGRSVSSVCVHSFIPQFPRTSQPSSLTTHPQPSPFPTLNVGGLWLPDSPCVQHL